MDTIAIDGSTHNVQISPDEKIIGVTHDDQYAVVANKGTEENPSNTVSKVDLNSNEVVETIEVGSGTHGIIISKDDQYIFVTNAFDDTVNVIENETSEVIATVEVGETPNGITLK
ncbi:YncE family protein [Carnobacterium alterfunditum]|uniref:YncE family protein n=1 Tax=Carnobacterium alterfunditum TaxID=28230 RepID=UPI00068B16B4|nr:cytochrome D1 domain-containing protein [Carnobacterium alterfunditum]